MANWGMLMTLMGMVASVCDRSRFFLTTLGLHSLETDPDHSKGKA